MQNIFGQNLDKGYFVVQIKRTNQGVTKRTGIVLGLISDDEGVKARVAWYEPKNDATSTVDSIVGYDDLVVVHPLTLPGYVVTPLEHAFGRGRAAL